MSRVRAAWPLRMLRLMSGDAVNIARDPMLMIAIVLSLAPLAALHFTGPAVSDWGRAAFGVPDLARILAGVAFVMPASLVGWVCGFLLLEDRDEGTLTALDVTPMGKSGFVVYRVTVSAFATMLISALAWPLLVRDLPAVEGLTVAVLVGVETALIAMALPALARNKVEGLALTKLLNLLSLAPLAVLLPTPFRLLAWVVPSTFVGELLGLAAPLAPTAVLIAFALAVHAFFLLILMRRLRT